VFIDNSLKNHLETSGTIKSKAVVLAEWNMNSMDNIDHVGNYRHRPLETNSIYRTTINTFDVNDEGNFYTDATYSDIKIDGGFSDTNEPVVFQPRIEKEQSLYSLEDCFGKFRPRSGINKLRYFDNRFSHHTNISMAQRPRYYMADRYDQFKYWTSYRLEENIERGIAKNVLNGQFFIDDAAPFVVYKNAVPANRLVVKMQTNVGDVDLGPFTNSYGSFTDPLYGNENKTTPIKWKIQTLQGGGWVDAISFDASSVRSDGSPIVGSDGYVEIQFGLIVPREYASNFRHAGDLLVDTLLPNNAFEGDAFLVKASDSELGQYYIWSNGGYRTFTPSYGWKLYEESNTSISGLVANLVDVDKYNDIGSGQTKYRDLEYISGIRIIVDTMNKIDSTFDLIEMSPRLIADLSDSVLDFNITKQASDLGINGLPVGQLLASTGSLQLFDETQAFNPNNPNSLIAGHLDKKIQFKFYEGVLEVADSTNYYVPIKTLYSESAPTFDNSSKMVTVDLRDMFFYFESLTAPQIFVQGASLSYAVSLLLDNIGFSNYMFKRVPGEVEEIIPDFFIPPDRTVAQILQEIAISTQTAMFFDEYNNFIMMSKNYMMPSSTDRATDLTLYGNDILLDSDGNELPYIDHVSSTSLLPKSKAGGVYTVGEENDIYVWSDDADAWVAAGTYVSTKNPANIVELTSETNHIYNGGKIIYTPRYLQKSYGSIRQAYLVDQDKTWIYKPALLWEVAGTEKTKSTNGEISNQSSFVLGAIPLNSKLTKELPQVVNHRLINNTIDFGEGIYWITRYNGYFYSNGEVIKFDAVQYNVPKNVIGDSGISVEDNNVWITSAQEYENYFSKLSFNGKMYPTGLVRVYAEPNYEIVGGVTRLKNGSVAKHGRGQFGTQVVDHEAGLSDYWSNPQNRRACTMDSSYLFSDADIPSTAIGSAGVNNTIAAKTTANGIIKNFFSSSYIAESELNSLRATQSGTVQSSALVLNGPSFTTTEDPLDSVSYIYKPLDSQYRHFGTRMRIVGKAENNLDRPQTPIGSTSYYSTTNSNSSTVNVGGASGGLAVMLNPETNIGYYFEIAALTDTNLESSNTGDNIYNIMFYKVKQKAGTTEAIPVRLWAGLTQILVDNGTFVGQSRVFGEAATTVYDLAVEYENIGSTRKFYLYVNNNIVAIVEDDDPLPIYNNMALFVRGSARCMFENIYAISNNYGKDAVYTLDTPVNSVFGDDEINVNESFRKYAMSGMVQSTYLSGIGSSSAPKYNLYFEEFGTIMREAAYFNVRYDKAFPALFAKLSPTFNNIKGYTVSGFVAGAYGAEFLVFNATDTALSLDESSGNYLRIQGVTFTQQSPSELSVDEYFSKKSDLSNPQISKSNLVYSPLVSQQEYMDIKYSRATHGKKEFSLEAPYIQTRDDANTMMGWLASKIMKPRKSIGIKLFSMPIVQLGDIVDIEYISNQGFDEVGSNRFVVYNIQYSNGAKGPSMTLFLSEVV
jgi:hypothetical protein